MSTVIKSVCNVAEDVTVRQRKKTESLKIYNIFTRYFSGPQDWMSVVKEAKAMGFDSIYLNPFHKTGKSKSMYSIVDMLEWDEITMGGVSHEKGLRQLKSFLRKCKKLGLKVFFDLVANHTAMDSPIVQEHPEWYERDVHGKIVRASCITESGKCFWEDCAKLDFSHPKNGLWYYLEKVCRYYLELGFSGFRCDVAAYVPSFFWEHLIGSLRRDYPDVIFLGEAFMVPISQVDELARVGFNYVFNSAKWWNGVDAWFFEQNNHYNDVHIQSVSFPDNHDTNRLMSEVDGNVELYKQRIFLMAVLTSAFEITYGFEYGFKMKCHVVKTRPCNIEATWGNFKAYLKQALRLRDEYEILRVDGKLTNLVPNSREIAFILKESVEDDLHQKALILLNLTNREIPLEREKLEALFQGKECGNEEDSSDIITLKPYDFKVYVATAELAPKIEMNDSQCLVSPRRMLRKSIPLKPLYPDEVLVEVHACGICGSDRKEFQNGRFFWRREEVGGHEFVGKVIQKGSLCKRVRIDDIVCNRIPREHVGVTQFGGYSRYAVVRECSLYVLPSNVNQVYATVIEPLACAVHTGKMIENGKNIAIVGSGPIAILLERYLHTQRTDKHITLLYKHVSVCKYVSSSTSVVPVGQVESHKLFEAPRSFDTIVECSGDATVIAKLSRLLSEHGRIVITGIYNDSLMKGKNNLSITTMMFHETTIQGSFLYTEKDFKEAAELIVDGAIDVAGIITTMPFDKCQEGFELPAEERLKVVVYY